MSLGYWEGEGWGFCVAGAGLGVFGSSGVGCLRSARLRLRCESFRSTLRDSGVWIAENGLPDAVYGPRFGWGLEFKRQGTILEASSVASRRMTKVR